MTKYLTPLLSLFFFTATVFAGPRLVLSTPDLAPESQIDFVFDAPMVPTLELGKTQENSWVVIQPELRGTLTWKAQNIAQLTLAQAPLIATSYTFSIPAGRNHLDQSPVPVGKFATASSEAFRVISARTGDRWRSDYSPATSSWTLVFNDAVDLTAIAPFIEFVSRSGQRVAAKVEFPTVQEAGSSGWVKQFGAWASRFPNNQNPVVLPDQTMPNVIEARPASPLPVGDGWTLRVHKGLPNRSANAALVKEPGYGIGDVKPFKVTEIHSRVQMDQPREVLLKFSQSLPKTLPDDFVRTCVDISPQAENLHADADGDSIVLSGNFTASDEYRVVVKPPLVSRAGIRLEGEFAKKIEFEHLKPQVAFPSEDNGQLASGSRQYRMLTLNLASAHVRVKKLTGLDLIRAFQGYRNFTGKGPDRESIEPTAPIPFGLVLGQMVMEREILLSNPLDTSKMVTFDWDEDLPKGMRCGEFFVEAAGKGADGCGGPLRPTAQALVQLTDIGLAWKLTEKEAMVYAFSCNTGAPLPKVKLQLYGEEATALQAAITNASGLATLPRSALARHLHATLGDDSYITAFDSTLETVGLWHFPIHYSWNKSPTSSRQAFLFTDRSVYRPGETMHLKGLVRMQNGNAIEAVKSGLARVVIMDPTEKEIHTSPVTLSASGSFDLTYTLPQGQTGSHVIRLEYPEEIARAEASDDWSVREPLMASARFEIPLQVQEFRRNAFEIAQVLAEPPIGAVRISSDLTASYYQGQPVAAGKVSYFSRITAKNPYPERFRDFLFGNHRTDDWGYWYHYFGYNSDAGEAAHPDQFKGELPLGADGKAKIELEIPQAEFPTGREVNVQAEVTDANNQTLTSMASTVVHPASIYIGISRNDKLVRVGEQMPLKIVATDTHGAPFLQSVRVTATLTREVNSTVKSTTATGATTTRNEVTEEPVETREVTIEPADSAKEGASFDFVPKANGRHFLTVRGTDPEGRAFATVIHFEVYGAHEYPWAYEDGLRIKLIAEKKSYKPGETARILVLSPIEGTALVTVERQKVLRSFQVELRADHPVVEVPVIDEDAPNAFVSVLIVKGAKESARKFKQPQLRLGYCELTVQNVKDTLAVDLQSSAPTYHPGDEASLVGKVTLANGLPASGAEVTLYAEDEGTLAVMGYETPRPMDYFFKPRTLDVETGMSFESFVPEDPELQQFNIKGYFVGGGGDFSKLADLLRKNFDPCATWAPAIITDARGRFTHTFKVPDTLTRYRIIAIAHHGTSRFGQTESAVVVKKQLMLEPKAPRFANQSDTVNTQVLVQNASAFRGTWEIQIRNGNASDGSCTSSVGPTTQRVSLAPGGSASLVFPIHADQTGEAVLTWLATPVALDHTKLTDSIRRDLTDFVEWRFPVEYPMPLLRQTKFVRLDASGTKRDLRTSLDPALLAGTGGVDVEFSRSLLLEAGSSIDYLLHYPYGCVEQTTSSLIPWLTVEELRSVVPSFAKVPKEKVAAAIQAGVDRLLSMQLPDGSFSYWPGGKDAVAWATAYAGMGLVMASEKGANVPTSAIEALAKNLTESLRGIADEKSTSALEGHTRALYVLALAHAPQPAYQNLLVDRIAELTPSARALLAAAIVIQDAKNPTYLAVAKSLLTSQVPLRLKSDDWMPWSPDDACRLIAWLATDPTSDEPTKALDRMLCDRNPYGHWRTTWVNGWSLLAMAAYAKSEMVASESVTLQLDAAKGTETISLTRETPVATRSFTLAPDLKLDLTSHQAAFVRLALASKPPIQPLQPVAKNGLSIDRIYERILANGSAEILTEPKVGDLIRVSLRVTLPKDGTRYLCIDDPLPAIFETVNSDFQSQRAAVGIPTSQSDWRVSHSELRSDRATFFLDEVRARGTYTVTYLVRCTLAGQAVAPPAKVESMYDPENFALSASRAFEVE